MYLGTYLPIYLSDIDTLILGSEQEKRQDKTRQDKTRQQAALCPGRKKSKGESERRTFVYVVRLVG
ncbi:hypothetical protein NEUTE1DRAFT_117264 [Neurospora tetrasperma FGSC 2508]|uniref:Uncharacterized protein n=1 Tax=Neurospora tetrasperma (strain FGSC 2508 / ATCC MYA-4615 / P0657) TaxID=510951 RepID=F8MPD7_NEUT8|nr:uncharacterized protein NEUTE1DRAFT_117264 [Neurospora tetrasperma FGSC 2508]EGO56302.1 hypothetical protein NEUTE1DRAFT_117264 [Neurospora tetrasperma FGSC 2508]EGZ70844.1 hypothetical protein NEUTE2DRAFT_145211 [Neurospora tetrasperma FGSC 2509]